MCVCAQVEDCAQGWLPLDKLGQAGAQHAPQPALALPDMPVMLHSPYFSTLVAQHVMPGLDTKTQPIVVQYTYLQFGIDQNLCSSVISALVSCDKRHMLCRQHCAEPLDNSK